MNSALGLEERSQQVEDQGIAMRSISSLSHFLSGEPVSTSPENAPFLLEWSHFLSGEPVSTSPENAPFLLEWSHFLSGEPVSTSPENALATDN